MRGEETYQKLLEHIPLEGFEYDPDQPPELLVSNVIRRVFVTLFAKTGDDLTRLAATADGELTVQDADAITQLTAIAGYLDGVETLITATNTALVTTLGAYLDGLEGLLAAPLVVSADAQIPDKWDGTTGTAGDAFGNYVAFGFTSKVVTILAVDHPLVIQMKDGGGAAGDEMRIPGDSGISLDLKATEYRLKNGSGGNNCVYTVIATGLA